MARCISLSVLDSPCTNVWIKMHKSSIHHNHNKKVVDTATKVGLCTDFQFNINIHITNKGQIKAFNDIVSDPVRSIHDCGAVVTNGFDGHSFPSSSSKRAVVSS